MNNARLIASLTECSDALEEFITAEYTAFMLEYPHNVQKKKNDMECVVNARSIIAELSDPFSMGSDPETASPYGVGNGVAGGMGSQAANKLMADVMGDELDPIYQQVDSLVDALRKIRHMSQKGGKSTGLRMTNMDDIARRALLPFTT